MILVHELKTESTKNAILVNATRLESKKLIFVSALKIESNKNRDLSRKKCDSTRVIQTERLPQFVKHAKVPKRDEEYHCHGGEQ